MLQRSTRTTRPGLSSTLAILLIAAALAGAMGFVIRLGDRADFAAQLVGDTTVDPDLMPDIGFVDSVIVAPDLTPPPPPFVAGDTTVAIGLTTPSSTPFPANTGIIGPGITYYAPLPGPECATSSDCPATTCGECTGQAPGLCIQDCTIHPCDAGLCATVPSVRVCDPSECPGGVRSGTIQCGDGDCNASEICDCEADCGPPPPDCPGAGMCGDGTVDPGEECDDGNTDNGDGCDADCRFEFGRCEEDVDCPPGWCTECTEIPLSGMCEQQCTDYVCVNSWYCVPAETTEQCDPQQCGMGVCGDGTIDPGEECDLGEDNGRLIAGGDCAEIKCHADCSLPFCGDVTLQACTGGEECDDGPANADEPDACRTNCRLPFCGDGIIDRITNGEQCDDGTLNFDAFPDACRTSCLPASCGDGVMDSGEECDDGNRQGGDGCDENCQFGGRDVCGDGVCGRSCVEEEGMEMCVIETCSNCAQDCEGQQDGCPVGQVCSGGVCSGGDVCGDGQITGTEACDTNGNVGCLSFQICVNCESCIGDPPPCEGVCCSTFTGGCGAGGPAAGTCGFNELCCNNCAGGGGVCGDGTVDPGEECDDENRIDWDGCSRDCWTETLCNPGFSCSALVGPDCQPGEIIERQGQCVSPRNEGPDITGDCWRCVPDVDVCGDGRCTGSETCSTCERDCGTCQATCGNGIEDFPNEQCDDGNLLNEDGCSSLCLLEQTCGNGRIEFLESCDDGGTCIAGTNIGATCTVDTVRQDCGMSGICEPQDGDGCSRDCRINTCELVGDPGGNAYNFSIYNLGKHQDGMWNADSFRSPSDPRGLEWFDDQFRTRYRLYEPKGPGNKIEENPFVGPEDNLPHDPSYFASKWEGVINVPALGNYTFSFGSQDDAWVVIDGRVVAAVPGLHDPMFETQGSIRLDPGEHPIEIYYASRTEYPQCDIPPTMRFAQVPGAAQPGFLRSFIQKLTANLSAFLQRAIPARIESPTVPATVEPQSFLGVPKAFATAVDSEDIAPATVQAENETGFFRAIWENVLSFFQNLLPRRGDDLTAQLLGETECSDTLDNDNDGLMNCADPGCILDAETWVRHMVSSQFKAFGVAAADFNGDGEQDIVAIDKALEFPGTPTAIILYTSEGGDPPSWTARSISSDNARSVHAVDLDGDGDRDIVAAGYVGSNDSVFWFENNGASSPAFTRYGISTSPGVYYATSADLNGDGRIDIIAGTVWYENGGGAPPTFTAHAFLDSSVLVHDAVAADLDSDGDQDIFTTRRVGGLLFWQRNDGAGSFTSISIPTNTTGADGWRSADAADLDADGDIDLLLGLPGEGKTLWYRSTGGATPHFTESVFDGTAGATDLETADLDADGDTDVAGVFDEEGIIMWYQRNNTAPPFAKKAVASSLNRPRSIVAADVNGDGMTDVVSGSITGTDSIALSWFQHLLPGACDPFDNDESLQCNDGRDNDVPLDNLVDAADPGCYTPPNVATGIYDPNDDDEIHTPSCGNGAEEAGEECDDGNLLKGDGCDDQCKITVQCNDTMDNIDLEDELADRDDPGCYDNGNVVTGTYVALYTDEANAIVCGNGGKEMNEECDDGNLLKGDGCDDQCQITVQCSDTVDNIDLEDELADALDPGCHDSENLTLLYVPNDPDERHTVRCGNGLREPNGADGLPGGGDDEACDDGNLLKGDGCDDQCQITVQCSDTVDNIDLEDVLADRDDPGCYDTGNSVTGTYVASDNDETNAIVCGNGGKETDEECDDGDANNTDSCPDGMVGLCRIAFCGDGFTWNTDGGTEQCDDGALNGQPNKCNLTCTGVTASICGNEVVEAGEECDDGCLVGTPGVCEPADRGDGCSDLCIITVECSDTVDNADTEDELADALDPGCHDSENLTLLYVPNDPDERHTVRCGNGLREPNGADGLPGGGDDEACDDGNLLKGDGCDDQCQITVQCSDTVDNIDLEDVLADRDDPGCYDTGNSVTGTYVASDNDETNAIVCGNGGRETGEECDDGCLAGIPGVCEPEDRGDGCSDLCRVTVECSDTVDNLDPEDVLADRADPGCYDNGNVVTGTYVASDNDETNAIVCGNGGRETGEECDDGNTINDDACSNACTENICGNSRVDPGEDCDDGNTINDDACSNACTENICGNSRVDPGEDCDDGCLEGIPGVCEPVDRGDGCSDFCRVTQQCDDTVDNDSDSHTDCADPGCHSDGNALNTTTCETFDALGNERLESSNSPACGDGAFDPGLGEECDDGNPVNGDGCSNTCAWEDFLTCHEALGPWGDAGFAISSLDTFPDGDMFVAVSDDGDIRIGTIDDNGIISWPWVAEPFDSEVINASVAVIDDTHVIVAYQVQHWDFVDSRNSFNRGYVSVGQVTPMGWVGFGPRELFTETPFDNVSSFHPAVDALGSTFRVIYTNNTRGGTFVRGGTVQGSTIQLGFERPVGPIRTTDTAITMLDDTNYIVAWIAELSCPFNRRYEGSVHANTMGNPALFLSAPCGSSEPTGLELDAVNRSVFVMSYNDSSSSCARLTRGTHQIGRIFLEPTVEQCGNSSWSSLTAFHNGSSLLANKQTDGIFVRKVQAGTAEPAVTVSDVAAGAQGIIAKRSNQFVIGYGGGARASFCAECQNQLDDDGDELMDIGADPGCAEPTDDDERNVCTNEDDDDNDGFTDCDDPGCHTDLNAANDTCDPQRMDENHVPRCGNGVEDQASEECDDGDADNADTCVNSCVFAACGDGFTQPLGRDGVAGGGNDEQCDDGNLLKGDGCDDQCRITVECSDTVDNLDPEDTLSDAADPGCYNNGNVVTGTYVANDTDETNAIVCGNGGKETGEECDDGNLLKGDGCDDQCRITVECSDTVDNLDEEDDLADRADPGCYDNGNVVTGTYVALDTDETNAIVCGNGGKETGEECDDGNLDDGDGCSALCVWEAIECGFGVTSTLVGTYSTSGFGALAKDVAVAGSYAYVAYGVPGLQIIDISNPASPTLAGTFNTDGSAVSVAVAGSYAYVADGFFGLQIIDVTNPALPTLTGTFNTDSSAEDVAVAGSYAYVADNADGLQIIDISDPTRPALAGSYDTSGTAVGVAVAGSYAYIAGMDAGLQIIDVTDPASPAPVGEFDTDSFAKDVAIAGSYAYVADGADGLQIVDISDPTRPALAGSYDTDGYTDAVAVAGRYAYVADSDAGLQIIDVSDPTAPAPAGAYDTGGNAIGVAIVYRYAYIADGNGGLLIIGIDCATVCGDGTVQSPNDDGINETCDDGNGNNNDSCPDGSGGLCQNAFCSDGFVWNTDGGNETCDDGNPIDGDGCSSACLIQECSDSIDNNDPEDKVADRGDPGCFRNGNITIPGDYDPNDPDETHVPSCGNGLTEPENNETCDDGNTVDGDGCSSTCQGTRQCNDGADNDRDEHIDCLDPGCHSDGNALNPTCETLDAAGNERLEDSNTPRCGDGAIDPGLGETCDDGNPDDGDGCSSSCQTTVQCSDGVDNGDPEDTWADTADPGCHQNDNLTLPYDPSDPDETHVPSCGNGSPDLWFEECDDGNTTDGDGCNASCFFERSVCNDGMDNDGDGSMDFSSPSRKATLNANIGTGTGGFTSAVSNGSSAFFGTATGDPGKIVKIRLSDFTHAGELSLQPGESDLTTAVIDIGTGFAYFGTRTGKIVKVDTRFTPPRRVEARDLGGEVAASVIWPSGPSSGGFAYFSVNDGQSRRIVKVRLSDFTIERTFTIPFGTYPFTSAAVIDIPRGYAYFGVGDILAGAVHRVSLSNLAVVDSMGFEGKATSAVSDGEYAYFAINTNPARIWRVNLSDFTRIGPRIMKSGVRLLTSAALDISGGATNIYFGTDTDPGMILNYYDDWNPLTLESGERGLRAVIVDSERRLAYFGGTYRNQGRIIQATLTWHDFGCSDASDDDERNVCTDEADNDDDIFIDCDDPGCHTDGLAWNQLSCDPQDMNEGNIARCGNGAREPNGADGTPGTADDEECDDGCLEGLWGLCEPSDRGDGCSDLCRITVECSDTVDNLDPEDTVADQGDPGCFRNGNITIPLDYDPNDPDEVHIPACGNGLTEPLNNEECDDGDADNTDTCVNSCVFASCGDGFTQLLGRNGVPGGGDDESCDDGVLNGQPNRCNLTCTGVTASVCGNTVVEAGEECDDGCLEGIPRVCEPVDRGDGCSDLCRVTTECSDTVDNADTEDELVDALDPGCYDNGNVATGTYVPSDNDETHVPVCGNGLTEPANNEECDDGNTVEGDGCSRTCLIQECSDGEDNLDIEDTLADTADPGCHIGEHMAGAYDPNDIDETHAPVCGNGLTEPANNEQCDDGNTVEGDGCSSTCQNTAQCGDGVDNADAEDTVADRADPGCYRNGNVTIPGDYDPNDPDETHVLSCGNGLTEPANDETCDDGNLIDGDGCSSACEGTLQCNDGTDNDDDGAVDCADFSCLRADGTCDTGRNDEALPPAACQDLEDNDFDGKTDYGTLTFSGMTIGAASDFNNSATDFISAAALDANRFAVAYRDGNWYSKGTVRVGRVAGGGIAWETPETVFNDAITFYVSVTALDADRFAVAYQDRGNNLQGAVRVGRIAGGGITWETPETVFNDAPIEFTSIVSLDADRFAVAYRDGGNGYQGTARVGTVTGEGIAWETPETVFNDAPTSYISVTALDADRFAVAYRDHGNNQLEEQGTVRVGRIAGGGIAWETPETVFNDAVTIFISVTALDADRIAVGYRDNGNAQQGAVRVGRVAGGGIAWETPETVFNNGWTDSVSVTALDADRIAVGYKDFANAQQGTVRVGRIAGGGIAWETPETVFNNEWTSPISLVAVEKRRLVHNLVVAYGTASTGAARPFRITYQDIPESDNDPGCESAQDNDERNACSDTSDNDTDTFIDCADPGCHIDGNVWNQSSCDPQDMTEENTARCGNGATEAGEECDDGCLSGTPAVCEPVDRGDGCSDQCRITVECSDTVDNVDAEDTVADQGDPGCFGNGNITIPADYDPGDTDETHTARCGNGLTEPLNNEQCDDGNTESTDSCTGVCASASCGDGFLQPLGRNGVTGGGDDETCDDGALNGEPNQCNATCTGVTASVCGNTVVEAGEECDDGCLSGTPAVCEPADRGDGCSDLCMTTVECSDTVDNVDAEDTVADQGDPGCFGNGNITIPADYDPGDTDETHTARCGNGLTEPFNNEQCDDGNTTDGDGCSATCQSTAQCSDGLDNADPEDTLADQSDPGCHEGENLARPYVPGDTDETHTARCGNGLTEPSNNEECDDGNLLNGDGCSDLCIITVECSDTVDNLDPEDTLIDSADPGCHADGDALNLLSYDENDPDETHVPACGDGITDAGEECDLGGGNSDTRPDACRTDCRNPFCGDNVTDTGEACDDGPDNSDTIPDACRTSCALPFCGDGTTDPSNDEQCDDGNRMNGDGCSNACVVTQQCSDTVDNLDPEDDLSDRGDPGCYDNGNVVTGTYVLSDNDETHVPACGNGAMDQTLEECDDGNTANFDGCSDACRVENYCRPEDIPSRFYFFFEDPSLTITPKPVCEIACGNGRTDTGEECDDRNTNDNDGCSAQCLIEFCGDAVTQPPREDCDPGYTCASGNVCAPDGIPCSDGSTCTIRCVEGNICTNECTDPLCLNGDVECGEECEPAVHWECEQNAGFLCDPQNNDAQGFNPVCLDRSDFCSPGGFCSANPLRVCDDDFDCEVPRRCIAALDDPGSTCTLECESLVPACSTDDDCIGENTCCLPDGTGGTFCGSCPVCGDGAVDAGEDCDDGKQCDGDPGLDCTNDPGVCASLGLGECRPQKGDGCNGMCQAEVCGNDILDPDEECDDGKQCTLNRDVQCQTDEECSEAAKCAVNPATGQKQCPDGSSCTVHTDCADTCRQFADDGCDLGCRNEELCLSTTLQPRTRQKQSNPLVTHALSEARIEITDASGNTVLSDEPPIDDTGHVITTNTRNIDNAAVYDITLTATGHLATATLRDQTGILSKSCDDLNTGVSFVGDFDGDGDIGLDDLARAIFYFNEGGGSDQLLDDIYRFGFGLSDIAELISNFNLFNP